MLRRHDDSQIYYNHRRGVRGRTWFPPLPTIRLSNMSDKGYFNPKGISFFSESSILAPGMRTLLPSAHSPCNPIRPICIHYGHLAFDSVRYSLLCNCTVAFRTAASPDLCSWLPLQGVNLKSCQQVSVYATNVEHLHSSASFPLYVVMIIFIHRLLSFRAMCLTT